MSRVGVSRSPSVSHLSDTCRPLRALSGMSDRELLSRVRDLVSRERAATLEVLVHLMEVERRKLFLGLGYPSMFEYCMQHLGYSGSAAARRIRAARCVRDYPEVYGLLEKNEVTLVTISLVAPILDESNANDLIAKIRGKSQRDVEAIVATYRPPVSMRDRARPVTVAVPTSSAPPTQRTSMSVGASAGSEKTPNMAADDAAASYAGGPTQVGTPSQALRQASTRASDEHSSLPATATTEAGQTSPARVENRFLIQFLASPQFMKKFEKARALLSNKYGSSSYEAVLETALDEFLKDHDPEKREQRREERKEKTEARTKSEERAAKETARTRAAGSICEAGFGQVDGPLFRRRAGDLPKSRVPADGGPTRHIPAAVRDAVFARDKGRCTYTGPDGKRCGSTHNFQIDHIVPFARGGTASVKNLRLLCGKHNRLSAERVFGPAAVRGRL